MSEIVELRGTLRDYAWGDPGFISRWLGLEPAEGDGALRPEAEWWMGAHAASPSLVRLERGWTPLPEWIAEDPAGRLGRASVEDFGRELPFLFKLLAAGQPLSLQAHPSTEQARAGFEREEREGPGRDDPRRNYRDPHPKPELLCALTPFDALAGFRAPADIVARFDALGIDRLDEIARPLQEQGELGLRDFFAALWQSDPTTWLGELVDRCRAQHAAPEAGWVVQLAAAFPGDAGAIAPLVLNRVHLEPGEAFYLPPRELHCYLRGAGIELMGNSDNVLRGGLTPKHVDVGELLGVLDFHARAPVPMRPVERSPGEWVYRSPAAVFELSRLEVADEFRSSNRSGFQILLCERGGGTVEGGEDGQRFEIARGQACAVSARVETLRVCGDLTLHRAALPER
ncbi:MAG: mannose-6-phosphate isomerase, class I [Myxococcota bacterium]|jgi:mannose-6-phosphate isomerase|nr:mannose-6-phosphate isomerase, class I [Myxococcota bacterium]